MEKIPDGSYVAPWIKYCEENDISCDMCKRSNDDPKEVCQECVEFCFFERATEEEKEER